MLAGHTWGDIQATSQVWFYWSLRLATGTVFLKNLLLVVSPSFMESISRSGEASNLPNPCGCGAVSSPGLKPVFQREKSCISATFLCSQDSVSALLTVAWDSWCCWQEEAGRTQEAQKDSDNNIQSFFFSLFHVLFPHIYSRRMAHMALFDSVFLKDPSTLKTVIRGACFMQSCLWCWLAGCSMRNNKEVPSFQSLFVLQENNCFLEGHSEEKSRNLEVYFHPLYSHMYIIFQVPREVLIKCNVSLCSPAR